MKKIYLIFVIFLFQIKSFGQDSIRIKQFVNEWIGKPYRYGGKTKKGIDCSAFVQRFYKDVFELVIPRTCSSQFKSSLRIDSSSLKIGDILFFRSRPSPSGWHCGIYLGNDEFIHSANYRDGVKISCFFDYQHLLKGFGRFERID